MNIERRLVDALEKNDLIKIEKVFNDIYNSNYKLVYFCVANFIMNKEDILELVDDVFINFYNHIHNINVDGSIKYYLTRSAKNLSINFIKKNNKEISIEDKYLENLSYVKMEYIDNSLFNDIKKILTEEDYNIIFNHIVLGYSLIEIAKEMDESKNTIKSKYRRALLKLKKELGGKYYE